MTTATISGNARKVRILAIFAMVVGAVFIVAGIVAWIAVSVQLAAENITVSDDAAFLAGSRVQGPLSAYAQAEIINHHALAMSDGKTYAELAQDDPTRDTVMNASFLRASLFTSVVSFGVALFAVGVGVLSMVFGYIAILLSRREPAVAV
ncbi:aromatic ring-opening dioxygenase LigA [Microbacterium keratanolyticum]